VTLPFVGPQSRGPHRLEAGTCGPGSDFRSGRRAGVRYSVFGFGPTPRAPGRLPLATLQRDSESSPVAVALDRRADFGSQRSGSAARSSRWDFMRYVSQEPAFDPRTPPSLHQPGSAGELVHGDPEARFASVGECLWLRCDLDTTGCRGRPFPLEYRRPWVAGRGGGGGKTKNGADVGLVRLESALEGPSIKSAIAQTTWGTGLLGTGGSLALPKRRDRGAYGQQVTRRRWSRAVTQQAWGVFSRPHWATSPAHIRYLP
jgi:hypothetical protein